MKDRPSTPAEPRTRVGFVTDAWIVGGGAERVLFTLLTGLDRARFEPVVFALFTTDTGADFCASVEARGIRVVRYRVTPRRNLRFIAEAARFLRDIKKGGFQAVHGSGDRGVGLLAARLAGVPVRVCSIHDVTARRWTLDHLLRVITLRWFATSVVAVSSAVATTLRAHYGVPASKISVIHNGVDDAFLAESSHVEAQPSADATTTKKVLTIARLDRAKGLDALLDAMALVIRDYGDVELHVVGQGDLRTALEKQAHELGITAHVKFHGHCTDVAASLLAADVFVLTSRSEGLGVAAIEAMAASRPVVASAVGGLPEVVIDGETGLLVSPRGVVHGAPELDPPAIAQAILRLLRDSALARSMGKAGRVRYQQSFAAPAFVRQHEILYSKEDSSRARRH
jgi:glycosyltransferase involved in cell wall biosynthesis